MALRIALEKSPTRVDSLFVTEFRIGRKLLLQEFLEFGPISPFEVRAVRESQIT
jgi:hypothetical protein